MVYTPQADKEVTPCTGTHPPSPSPKTWPRCWSRPDKQSSATAVCILSGNHAPRHRAQHHRTPPSLPRLCQRLHRARLVLTPGINHAGPVDTPNAGYISAAPLWWKRHSVALQAAPVPSRHSMGEPLEAVPLLGVPPVPSVPPHIHKAGPESRPRQREGVPATDRQHTAPSRMAGAPPGNPPPKRYSRTGWPLAGNSSPDSGLCTGDSCAARFLVALEASPALATAQHRSGTAKPAKRTARGQGVGIGRHRPMLERMGEPSTH